MTRAYDIKELVAEEASGTAERRVLEEVAHRLEESLAGDVPYRPEFKAQLRRQLIAQARQQLTPWYRRPAFFGSGMAVAAAAAVLFVGLRFWESERAPALPPQAENAPQVTPPASEPGQNPITRVSALPADLTQVTVADEQLNPALPVPEAVRGAEVAQGLQLKRLTARPNGEQLRSMASRLAFRGESRRTSAGWEIMDEDRSLILQDDGQVSYTDSTPPAGAAGAKVTEDAARQAAYQFLDKALLPVPGQPVVSSEPGGYAVVYTEQVENRPVVNARTQVLVSEQGKVTRAQAYVSSGTETQGTYVAVTQAEALAEAANRGGSFDRADLVWVRTPGEGTIYLQPYWRVFGTDQSGTPVVRYVPALKR